MYLCSNNMQSIVSLVDTLRIPSMETRVCDSVSFSILDFTTTKCFMPQEVILDMFFEILNIEVPDWGQAFMDGRRLTSECESKAPLEQTLRELG